MKKALVIEKFVMKSLILENRPFISLKNKNFRTDINIQHSVYFTEKKQEKKGRSLIEHLYIYRIQLLSINMKKVLF